MFSSLCDGAGQGARPTARCRPASLPVVTLHRCRSGNQKLQSPAERPAAGHGTRTAPRKGRRGRRIRGRPRSTEAGRTAGSASSAKGSSWTGRESCNRKTVSPTQRRRAQVPLPLPLDVTRGAHRRSNTPHEGRQLPDLLRDPDSCAGKLGPLWGVLLGRPCLALSNQLCPCRPVRRPRPKQEKCVGRDLEQGPLLSRKEPALSSFARACLPISFWRFAGVFARRVLLSPQSQPGLQPAH